MQFLLAKHRPNMAKHDSLTQEDFPRCRYLKASPTSEDIAITFTTHHVLSRTCLQAPSTESCAMSGVDLPGKLTFTLHSIQSVELFPPTVP